MIYHTDILISGGWMAAACKHGVIYALNVLL